MPYPPIKKNVAGQLIPISVFLGKELVTSVPLAAGDFVAFLDFSSLGNITVTEDPASSGILKVAPSQAMTNGSWLVIRYKDQTSPAAWDSGVLCFPISDGVIDANISSRSIFDSTSDNVIVGTIATDAITAAALSAGAVAEIQAGLSTFDPGTDSVIVNSVLTDAITNLSLAASAITKIQAGLSTFNPATTNVTVGALVANAITAASIAADAVAELQAGLSTFDSTTDPVIIGSLGADAITAATLAASAIAEIQAGLSTFDHTTDQVIIGGLGADAITAATIAADAVAEIQSGLSTFNPAADDVSVRELQVSALADMFNTDSGLTIDDAIPGSVVLESSGASSISPQVVADAVWNWLGRGKRTLTLSAVQIAAILQSGGITCYRDATITIPITGLGSIVDRTKLILTVKRSFADPDSQAILQVEESVLNAGLLYVNKTAAAVLGPVYAADGWITVDDENEGDITIKIKARAATLLPFGDGFVYDIKVWRDNVDDDIDPLSVSIFNIRGLATRTVASWRDLQ